MTEIARTDFLRSVAGLVLTGCGRLGNFRGEFEQSSGVATVEGAELHYVIEGEGMPCIVLGHSESGRRILSRTLRKHFRFVFLDLRHDARSKSSLEISKVTLNTYLSDIDAVRKTLGLPRTALLGHSYHALIGLEYARTHPQNISHLIMTGCTPRTVRGAGDEFWESDASADRKLIFDKNWEELPLDELSRMPPKERYIRTYVAMTPKLFYDPVYDVTSVVEVVDNDRDVFLHLQLVILNGYDIAGRPGRIAAPVFLAIGRYDYVAPYRLWDNRQNILPNLSYNLFEKSGHFPMVEERELFDKRLIEWIGDH